MIVIIVVVVGVQAVIKTKEEDCLTFPTSSSDGGGIVNEACEAEKLIARAFQCQESSEHFVIFGAASLVVCCVAGSSPSQYSSSPVRHMMRPPAIRRETHIFVGAWCCNCLCVRVSS